MREGGSRLFFFFLSISLFLSALIPLQRAVTTTTAPSSLASLTVMDGSERTNLGKVVLSSYVRPLNAYCDSIYLFWSDGKRFMREFAVSTKL